MVVLLSFGMTSAQDGNNKERIHAIKVGFITEKIQLTTDQAAKFWPVYNRYEDERGTLRRNFYAKYPRDKQQDQQSSMQYVDDNLAYQEQQVALKRKYKDEFLKIISAQQLAQLYQAEREFKKMLVDQLKDKRGGKEVQ
jgi:hypothetical protein